VTVLGVVAYGPGGVYAASTGCRARCATVAWRAASDYGVSLGSSSGIVGVLRGCVSTGLVFGFDTSCWLSQKHGELASLRRERTLVNKRDDPALRGERRP